MVKLFLGLVLCVPLAVLAETITDFKSMFGGEWYDNPSCKGKVTYEYNEGVMELYNVSNGPSHGTGVTIFLTENKRNQNGSYTVEGTQFNKDMTDGFYAIFSGNGKEMNINSFQENTKINTTLYNCGSKYKSIFDD